MRFYGTLEEENAMRYEFCPKCGSKLVPRKAGDDGNVPYCGSCGKYWFDSFASCVIVLTYNEYDEMVICRQNYLSDIYATITSGYITPGETAEEAGIRELYEELGLTFAPGSLEYGGTYWFDRGDMLMHAFLAYHPKCALRLSEEVNEARWIPAVEAHKYLFPERPGNAAFALLRLFLKKRGLPQP